MKLNNFAFQSRYIRKNNRRKRRYGRKRGKTCAAHRVFPAWRFGWFLVAERNIFWNKSAAHRRRPYTQALKFKRKVGLKQQASAWDASNFLSEINLRREQKKLHIAIAKPRKQKPLIVVKRGTTIASTIPNLSLSARVSHSSALQQTQIILVEKSIPGRSADAWHGLRWLHSLIAKPQTCICFRRKRNSFF